MVLEEFEDTVVVSESSSEFRRLSRPIPIPDRDASYFKRLFLPSGLCHLCGGRASGQSTRDFKNVLICFFDFIL